MTPNKFRRSKLPGNMHNYIWCPYYLQSFMKFCSVVSEELRWQAASVVNVGKFLSSKEHNSHKIQAIEIAWLYAQLHMVSLLYLSSFMKFCSVVSEELGWQAVSVVNFRKFLSSKGHNSHSVLCTTTYGVVTIYQVSWNSVQFQRSCADKLLQKCISGIFSVQRGITPTKFRGSKFHGNMHNNVWCPYYLSRFIEILFSTFRGVVLTSCFSSKFREISKFKGA